MNIPRSLRNRVILSILITSIFQVPTYPNELQTRAQIAKQVNTLFVSGNYEQLDRLARQYRETEERTSSGLWKLRMFYAGFENLFLHPHPSMWPTYRKQADQWIAQYPDSPTAYVVKGILLNKFAWYVRGGSWAKDVPQDAWKLFRERLDLAREYVLQVRDNASSDPHWYYLTSEILKAQGEDLANFVEFMNSGFDAHPRYYPIYFASMDYLAPKWHGDKDLIERFASQAAVRTKETEGMGLYARIYWAASQSQYRESLFTDSDVVWPKMRQGIFDVLDEYPDSWNIQNFAFFSCLAGDKETTKALMGKMTRPMIQRAWRKLEYYEYCQDFVDQE